MFSKSNTTKPKSNDRIYSTYLKFGYSNAEYLGNGQILICNKHDSETYLLLHDSNSNKKIKEKLFMGFYSYFSFPNEDRFLLCSQDRTIILCKKTLETLQDIPLLIEPQCSLALVDNHLFCMASDMTAINLYNKANKFAKETIPLITTLKVKTTVQSIKQLANGLIACEFSYGNFGKKEIILLKLLKEPFLHCVEAEKETLMTMEGWTDLPSGNILTYDATGKQFQEWKGAEPIKSWAFELEPPLKPRQKLSIYPLIDDDHLLLQSCKTLTLYSKKTGLTKTVDLYDQSVYDILTLSNGLLLIEAEYINLSYFLLINLDEIKEYKKELYKTLNKTTLLEKYVLLKEIMRINELDQDLTKPLFFPLIFLFTIHKTLLEEAEPEQQSTWCSIQ